MFQVLPSITLYLHLSNKISSRYFLVFLFHFIKAGGYRQFVKIPPWNQDLGSGYQLFVQIPLETKTDLKWRFRLIGLWCLTPLQVLPSITLYLHLSNKISSRYFLVFLFHCRACLVMLCFGFLSVCPIHLHFLLFNSSSTGAGWSCGNPWCTTWNTALDWDYFNVYTSVRQGGIDSS
jgi:hypothetical protein